MFRIAFDDLHNTGLYTWDYLLTIQFDNRGSKVLSKDTNARILKALAEKVFLVPVGNVATVSGIGQSGLLNHQSTVTYAAVGPSVNGKTVIANCQTNTKSGWFSGAQVEKALKKATDTWMPGDSVKVQKASCSLPTGRKMV
eukprot:gene10782-10939_t